MAEPAKKAQQWEDPILSVMRQTSAIPEYQQMINFLQSRDRTPVARTAWLGTGMGGLFTPGPTYADRSTITLNEGSGTADLVHEITHATEGQMKAMLLADPKSKFASDFVKLDPQQTLKAIAPAWTELASRYRSKSEEARGFAMENVTNPKLDPLSITRAPAHIDSTIASELMILLDLAQREQLKSAKKPGR